MRPHTQNHTWCKCKCKMLQAFAAHWVKVLSSFLPPILTSVSRRLPRRGRSLQMRTVYFILWENVALSPSPTTSSSPPCYLVSTFFFFLFFLTPQTSHSKSLSPNSQAMFTNHICRSVSSRLSAYTPHPLRPGEESFSICSIFRLTTRPSACPAWYLLPSKLITCPLKLAASLVP